MFIVPIHSSSPEGDGVPGAGLHDHLSATGGAHKVITTGSVVYSLPHSCPVMKEIGVVPLLAVYPRIHTVANFPNS